LPENRFTLKNKCSKNIQNTREPKYAFFLFRVSKKEKDLSFNQHKVLIRE